MDTEYAAVYDGGSAANTVLLPESSITNGAGHEAQNLDFLVEDILQVDPMAKAEDADVASSPRKTRSSSKRASAPEDDMEPPETPATRMPTQLPKKRRDAALLAAAALEGFAEQEELLQPVFEHADAGTMPSAEVVESIKSEIPSGIDVELPTSSTRAANKQDSVDEEQCRVCTTKDDLVSLFKKVEALTVAEMLMIICPAVSIARKDFMPQYICNTCLDNVTIAVQLKNQCEATEKSLRKQLSRSKNKLRRPTGYVVIDAPLEDDPPSDEEPNDDKEFKVSDAELSHASADDDSSGDSEYEDVPLAHRKKRTSRGGVGARGGRGRRKSSALTPASKTKQKKRMGRPPTRKTNDSANEKVDNDPVVKNEADAEASPTTETKQKKKKPKAEKDSIEKQTEYPCDECEQIFTRKLSLVLHKKTHSGGREPINCEVCGKQFKIQGAYRTHLEKHKDDQASTHACSSCDKSFMSKSDLRKHVVDVHEDLSILHTCDKCKRVFTTQARLERHQESRCPGFESKTPRRADYESFGVGKDLFKTVAPLTTTYWSDSFSD